jgi:hypothetical protein
MFRSLFHDHLQGSSFALSAPTTLQLHASPFVCIGMWSYALYLYVYPVYLPVCCPVVLCTRHVLGDIITHHQELLNCIFTASGDTYVHHCLPPVSSDVRMYHQKFLKYSLEHPDDER